MRKLLTVATISTLASLGAVAAVAGSANAASGSGSGDGVIIESTASYVDPTTNSDTVHHFDQGDIVDTTCWTNGEYMDGSYTWLKVNHGGIAAYVHRASISPPTGLDHC